MVEVHKFDICLINLDPTLGSEIQKKRPCVVISPDSMNLSRLKTIIIAPMTTKVREGFPTRLSICFDGKNGQIALDQLRALDRSRIIQKIGKIRDQTMQSQIKNLLQVMFI